MNAVTPKLWHHIHADDNKHYQTYWETLDAAEKSRAASIKNESRRKRYIAVHGLLRSVLSQVVQEPAQQLNIAQTRQGKPFLVEFPDLSFNLSHTADTLVIAVGQNCQLGVDIELCKPRTSLPALVEQCFAEIEAAWWSKLPENEKTREFFRIWTRKEAFVKATGHGIALGMKRCITDPENSSGWLSVPESCGKAEDWHVRDVGLDQHVCIAIVANRAIADVELVFI